MDAPFILYSTETLPETDFSVNKISAVLFDLDGLLADTEDLHVMAYSLAFDRFGIKLTDEEIFYGMGFSTRENVERIVRNHDLPQDRIEKMVELRYDSYYNLVLSNPVPFMEGAVECLLYIKQKGLKSALVTSSIQKHAAAVLSNLQEHADPGFEIKSCFDVLVFGDEIKDSKPEPEIYLKAVERLDIEPCRCLALEDSEAGVISAKNAGVTVYAIPNKYTGGHNYDRADRIFASLGEFIRSGLID